MNGTVCRCSCSSYERWRAVTQIAWRDARHLPHCKQNGAPIYCSGQTLTLTLALTLSLALTLTLALNLSLTLTLTPRNCVTQVGSYTTAMMNGKQWQQKTNLAWFDFLCANHAGNLPMYELNRMFQTYITKELGKAMNAIQAESGGRSRVEASGILFLRSLCRLTHTGHAQYAKGDGIAFSDFLKRR
jgi:hypothetical protein